MWIFRPHSRSSSVSAAKRGFNIFSNIDFKGSTSASNLAMQKLTLARDKAGPRPPSFVRGCSATRKEFCTARDISSTICDSTSSRIYASWRCTRRHRLAEPSMCSFASPNRLSLAKIWNPMHAYIAKRRRQKYVPGSTHRATQINIISRSPSSPCTY